MIHERALRKIQEQIGHFEVAHVSFFDDNANHYVDMLAAEVHLDTGYVSGMIDDGWYSIPFGVMSDVTVAG
jgi:hypothetical protein